jgi:hypothetical protein
MASYQCPKCDETFETPQKLGAHSRYKHPKRKKRQAATKPAAHPLTETCRVLTALYPDGIYFDDPDTLDEVLRVVEALR